MRMILCVFLMLNSLTPLLNAVVVIIHGSFAQTAEWCSTDGAFFKIIEAHAATRNHKVIPFCWSGTPTDTEIIKSAHSLAKVILSYPPTEEIIIIAHSHGGNVLAMASALLHTTTSHSLATDIIITPVQLAVQLQALLTHHSFSHGTHPLPPLVLDHSLTHRKSATITTAECKKIINHFTTQPLSFTPKKQALRYIIHALTDLHQKKHHYFKQHDSQNTLPKKYLINAAYLLATPVDMKKFAPHMEIINHLFQFYSHGDWVQPVLGFYQRYFPPHERRANFVITLKKSTFSLSEKPSHSCMHDALIAHWLLSIPFALQHARLGNFEQFTLGKNGKIHFEEGKIPHYL